MFHISNARHFLIVLLLSQILTLAATAQGMPGKMQALPGEFQSALQKITPDPPPPRLAGGVHFPVSNEKKCYLWRETLTGRGGMFIGVGTDQNYLMAGWARPEVLVLMDFDQLVADLHLIYGYAFKHAEDPRQFMRIWSAGNAREFREGLEREFTDQQTRDRVVEAFKRWRGKISERLDFLLNHHKHLGIRTFLDDQDQYRYVAGLFNTGRVLVIRGDLTASGVLREIGRVATQMKMPVRVLYLSNAEHYFTYSEDFRKNVMGLPFDDRSIVLRTATMGEVNGKKTFIYAVQESSNFVEWLKQPDVGDVTEILKAPAKVRRQHLHHVVALPKVDNPKPH